MVVDLKRLIANVNETAKQTAASAEQIAAWSQMVQAGAKATSEAMAQTATTVNVREHGSGHRKDHGGTGQGVAQITETSLSISDQLEQIASACRNSARGANRSTGGGTKE